MKRKEGEKEKKNMERNQNSKDKQDDKEENLHIRMQTRESVLKYEQVCC